MNRHSLTLRLVIAVVALDLILTGLLIGIGVFVARTQLLSAFDTTLSSKASSLRALVRYSEDDTSKLLFDPSGLPASADAEHSDIFAIYDGGGHLLASSPGWSGMPAGTRNTEDGYTRFRQGQVPFRGLILKDIGILDREDELNVPPAKITVIYAASLLDVRRRVLIVGWYLGVCGILCLALVVWPTIWTVRRSLNPLHELTAEAGRITARDWSFHPPETASRAGELAPLTTALQMLIERLGNSFASQRRFTSDLAHELKTHVAIIKSSLQVLLQKPRTAQEYHAGAAALLDDCERLEMLVERMLRLARVEQYADGGPRKKLEATDVAATCEAALTRVSALAASRQVEIRLETQECPPIEADPEDLELVWLNLLDNAVRHSAPGSTVLVHVSQAEGGVALKIQDSGEGIAREDLPHVFERFRRGSNGRGQSAGGFGLGLAICKAIVEAYDGKIGIESSATDGTLVEVFVPRRFGQRAEVKAVTG